MKKWNCSDCGWHIDRHCIRYGIGYRKNRKRCWQSKEEVEKLKKQKDIVYRIENKVW